MTRCYKVIQTVGFIMQRFCVFFCAFFILSCGEDAPDKGGVTGTTSANNTQPTGPVPGDSGPVTTPVLAEDAATVLGDYLCDYYRGCKCGEIFNVNLDVCEQGMPFIWGGVLEDAAELGLTYDAECMQKRINAMRDRGCQAESGQPFAGFCQEENCQIFHGNAAEGEMCQGGRQATMSTCEQGLLCTGTCVQPCTVWPGNGGEGDTCRGDDGGVILFCDAPLLCSVSTKKCETLPVDGEPCVDRQCDVGLTCHQSRDGLDAECGVPYDTGEACETFLSCKSFDCVDGSCTAPGEPGEMCAQTCVDGYQCNRSQGADQSICEKLPADGEACLSELFCQEGSFCLNGTTCTRTPKSGEACVNDADESLPCDTGLLCANKVCEQGSNLPGCGCGDNMCFTRVCIAPPPAVCNDNAFLY